MQMFEDFPKATPNQAKEMIGHFAAVGDTVMLWGEPSTAKSAIAQEFCDDYNLEMIDFRLSQAEPHDLNGYPDLDRDNKKAGYLPFDVFPLEGDPLPPGKDGWCLFLDESSFVFGTPMERAMYKVTNDHMIGNSRLHPRCVLLMAGNTVADGPLNGEISNAQKTRIRHIVVVKDTKGFIKHMRDVVKADYRLCSYLEFQKAHIHEYEPERADGMLTYACYRTWEAINKLLNKIPDFENHPLAYHMASASLGQGVAKSFLAYLKYFQDLPLPTQVEKAPQSSKVPTEPGAQFAMAASLGASVTHQNVAPFITYLERMGVEMQLTAIREMYRTDHTILGNEHVSEWKAKFGADFT